MVDTPLKTCSRCKVAKPEAAENFSFIKVRDRFNSWCKPCCAEWRRAARAADPEKARKIEAEYLDRNLAKVNAHRRARYEAKKGAEVEKYRARREANKDRWNENRRRKMATDPAYAERVREQGRKWREANAEKSKATAKASWNRRKQNPATRLRNNISSAISHALRGSRRAGDSWEALVGYSLADLRAHLERQFLPGMSWENYGDWHVDHRIPAVSFVYDSPEDAEFRACWSLANLQPLWWQDNLSKRDKRLLLL